MGVIWIIFLSLQLKKRKVKALTKGEQGQDLQTLVLAFDGTGRKEDEPSPFHEVVVSKYALDDTSNFLSRLIRDIIPRYLGGIKTKERNTVKKAEKLEEIRTKYTSKTFPFSYPLKQQILKKRSKMRPFTLPRATNKQCNILSITIVN